MKHTAKIVLSLEKAMFLSIFLCRIFGIMTEFVYFYSGIGLTPFHFDFLGHKEAQCLSCKLENLRNSQEEIQGWHSGSHA